MRFVFANGRDPVPSGISKWLCRHPSQEVCPWNERFARALPRACPEGPRGESPYAAREALAGKDARTLARALLGMSQQEFSRAFRNSPIKRAKIGGMKRNAAVVLGNLGSDESPDVLLVALHDPEPLARTHAAWALGRSGASAAAPRLRERLAVEPEAAVREALRAAVALLEDSSA